MKVSAFVALIVQNVTALKQICVMAVMKAREKYFIVLREKNVQYIIAV